MLLLDTNKTIDEPWLPALKIPWYSESLLLDYGCEGEAEQLHVLHQVTLILSLII